MDENLCWRVEEACRYAWPALVEQEINGWLIRFSQGTASRRINSINPTQGAAETTSEIIAGFEELYSQRGRQSLIRVPEFTRNSLGALLDARDYTKEGETSTLFARLDQNEYICPDGVRVAPRADAGWMDCAAAVNPRVAQDRSVLQRIFASFEVKTAFASLERNGETASIAYAAIHHDLVVIESVITVPEWRGRGLANAVVCKLLGWAITQGARGACVQVVSDNARALRLYHRLGFGKELYRYHYRRKAA